jgi:hypothetical protein
MYERLVMIATLADRAEPRQTEPGDDASTDTNCADSSANPNEGTNTSE